ncbi:protein mono-ADP-ribosyltransferase TIPARP-like [Notolabrus celidotus]|uniref:protein mono-ADP-ribosyltransferase TIPARP-like n=1 Tax=Notolabrus celidotus TaxID=1203425 RepID=UPI00148FF5D0|nr:protein mono-ADP-ribosyltransferase TIPARP-like [Notolabrus celidotus]
MSKMPPIPSSRGPKRKMEQDALPSEAPSKSSKVTFLSPSLLLLEIPADTNTSLPVWEAMRSQQVDVAWIVNPYGISVHVTPLTSFQGKISATREGESGTTLSTSHLKPQVIIKSISQQQSPAHNTPCVLLSFPQNSTQLLSGLPGQSQTIPLIQNTSLLVHLPLIITQPQPAVLPSTPTKKDFQPTLITPTTTPTKEYPPSSLPATSPFHTRSCSDTLICDNFMLNVCHAGRKCKLYHTPYPFHWQLWAVITHRWVDLAVRSQVLLERMYCDVNQEVVVLKDGDARYSLTFDSMELDDQSKYNGVRRLTNSDSLLKNPHFPNKWEIYWWNNLSWEEYEKTLSALLLNCMSKKEPKCYFQIGVQKYKVDFTAMTQTNVRTGFQRDIRCRPVYRSPRSMQPFLQTGIQAGPSSDPPADNFSVDPLEEFSSWYPPVWSLVCEQDYSLVDVPADSEAHRRVRNLFYESLPESKVDIIGIQQVQNLLHWDKYQRHKLYMQKHHDKQKETLERHLFHGTNKEAAQGICVNNFDPRMAGHNGTSFGFGSYFATAASFSNSYAAMAGPNEVHHMFLAKVLVGKASLGKNHYNKPPPLSSKTKQYCFYDSCVDNQDKPSLYVVFDRCQCYPYYLIKYKELPNEVEV